MNALKPAAAFTCSVIDSLRSVNGSGSPLLPQGVMLNINYPPLPPEQIRGVLYPEVSGGHMIQLAYRRNEDNGHVEPFFVPGVDPAEPQREHGDVRAHLEGYITISPVKPSWNPSEEEAGQVRESLASLLGGN